MCSDGPARNQRSDSSDGVTTATGSMPEAWGLRQTSMAKAQRDRKPISTRPKKTLKNDIDPISTRYRLDPAKSVRYRMRNRTTQSFTRAYFCNAVAHCSINPSTARPVLTLRHHTSPSTAGTVEPQHSAMRCMWSGSDNTYHPLSAGASAHRTCA